MLIIAPKILKVNTINSAEQFTQQSEIKDMGLAR